MSLRTTLLATSVAIATLATPSLASASSGGVRIVTQSWSPANPGVQSASIVFDRPGLLSDGLNAGWAKAREPICAACATSSANPTVSARDSRSTTSDARWRSRERSP